MDSMFIRPLNTESTESNTKISSPPDTSKKDQAADKANIVKTKDYAKTVFPQISTGDRSKPKEKGSTYDPISGVSTDVPENTSGSILQTFKNIFNKNDSKVPIYTKITGEEAPIYKNIAESKVEPNQLKPKGLFEATTDLSNLNTPKTPKKEKQEFPDPTGSSSELFSDIISDKEELKKLGWSVLTDPNTSAIAAGVATYIALRKGGLKGTGETAEAAINLMRSFSKNISSLKQNTEVVNTYTKQALHQIAKQQPLTSKQQAFVEKVPQALYKKLPTTQEQYRSFLENMKNMKMKDSPAFKKLAPNVKREFKEEYEITKSNEDIFRKDIFRNKEKIAELLKVRIKEIDKKSSKEIAVTIVNDLIPPISRDVSLKNFARVETTVKSLMVELVNGTIKLILDPGLTKNDVQNQINVEFRKTVRLELENLRDNMITLKEIDQVIEDFESKINDLPPNDKIIAQRRLSELKNKMIEDRSEFQNKINAKLKEFDDEPTMSKFQETLQEILKQAALSTLTAGSIHRLTSSFPIIEQATGIKEKLAQAILLTALSLPQTVINASTTNKYTKNTLEQVMGRDVSTQELTQEQLGQIGGQTVLEILGNLAAILSPLSSDLFKDTSSRFIKLNAEGLVLPDSLTQEQLDEYKKEFGEQFQKEFMKPLSEEINGQVNDWMESLKAVGDALNESLSNTINEKSKG